MNDDSYVTPRIRQWRRWTDTPLLILALGSIPILLLELERQELGQADRVFIVLVNAVVLVAFLVDYVVELALSSNRRMYIRNEWLNLVIVVAQGFVFVPSLAGFGVLRVVRGAPLFRIVAVTARILAIGGAARRDGRQRLRREAGNLALGAAAMTWLTSAAAFTLAEDVGDGGRIPSFFDALWWSTATITTVGYGDITPVTTAGRLVGMVTMFIGISSFAVVTAKIAEWLVVVGTEEPSLGESRGAG